MENSKTLEKYQAALKKYGRHETFCGAQLNRKCDCGLEGLLKAAEEPTLFNKQVKE